MLEIIRNGERESDMKFDTDAIASVTTVVQGSPYLASLLCHHAGHAALDMGRSTVLPADVAQAVDETVADFESRIPKPLRAHVRRLFDQGKAEPMALAARAALAADGLFSVADLVASSELTARKAQEIVEMLAMERVLKAANEADGEARYAFVEDGLATLIWMTWAQRNLQADPRQLRTATAS